MHPWQCAATCSRKLWLLCGTQGGNEPRGAFEVGPSQGRGPLTVSLMGSNEGLNFGKTAPHAILSELVA